jgi:hypothetical protein
MKSLKLISALMVIWLTAAACGLPGWLTNGSDSGTEAATETQISTAAPTETFVPTRTLTSTPPDPSLEILDRTDFITSEDPRYEIDLVWPNLAGAETAVGAFNTEMEGWIKMLTETFITDITTRTEQMNIDQEMPQSYLRVSYETLLQSQGLVSFHVRVERYYAMAAHPGHVSRSLNYDAVTGAFISLADLFRPDADYLSRILPIIENELAARDFGYVPGTAQTVMEERENWNLMPEGLRIHFDEYEVAPYAAGPQSVLVPWENLKDLIDSEGPAARLDFLP